MLKSGFARPHCDIVPKCVVPFEPDQKELELISQLDSYHKICEFLQNYIGSDCWAVTANQEVLFSQYNNEFYIRERIQDDMIRDYLTKNIHAHLFVYVFETKKECVVNLYMFGKDSYRLEVTYTPTNDVTNPKNFSFKYFKSN